MSALVVKHASLWIVFGFFYMSGLEMALRLAIDGQQDPTLIKTLSLTFLFSLLVGHLIRKYEKMWPMLASVVISLTGIAGFGYYFTERFAQYSVELGLGLCLSLPVATFVVGKIKLPQNKADK
jgi:cyanate permease